MKIGIVSAHYMPEIGYQEVHLAKAYARLGYTVKVFTSSASVKLGKSINQLAYKKGVSKDPKYGYDILRLPSLSYKSKSIPFGLYKAVVSFNPDVLIVLGVAKIFPRALLNNKLPEHIKIISIYGDAKEYFDTNTFKQKIKTSLHKIGFSAIKHPLYRRAINHGDKLVLNIPETNDLFLDFLNTKDTAVFESKKLMLNLGFDPDEYFYNDLDREQKRTELNISENELTIITSTRVNKRKKLEQIIDLITDINKHEKKVNYIIVGFLDDSYEQELKAYINKQKYPDAYKCFPFLNAKEIRNLYCAADLGIWLKVAISIQEAMGTGLPVLLENKPSVSHLIKNGINGWLYDNDNFSVALHDVVTKLILNKTDRNAVANYNAKYLSYDVIAQKILDSIK